jgi:uncharacterized protein (DUF433 family)
MTRYSLEIPAELKRDAESYAAAQGVSFEQFILWAIADKVSSLRTRLDDPNFPQIAYVRGPSGVATPVVAGTAVRVQTIVVAAQQWKMAPAEIAADLYLSEAQVQAALAFYEAHTEEVDQAIATEATLEVSHG